MIALIRRSATLIGIACSLWLPGVNAQTPAAPRAVAPIDLTGYWVALVTEDWRYRMLNAPKGDYYSIPLNDEGRRVADTWNPQRDIAQGKQCMSYGAPNIMREPARLHITWANDETLKVEIDAGKQTRMFSFARPQPVTGEATVQGTSFAAWQTPQSIRAYLSKMSAQDPNTPGFREASMAPPPPPPDTRRLGGTLKVVTTHIRPGYIRNNGVPFSANAVMTEYYDVHSRKGADYLVITQILDDPQYLNAPWIVSNQFRREADGSKWDPEPCELLLPTK
ncbi:MAG TPA: hypothetical protein VMH80_10980 [Bryobacteraceae bacterium]|nr:hypothetical protein [Bryobacteraceae bacterium]